MTQILDAAVATLAVIVFFGLLLVGLGLIARAKCWQYTNRNVLLVRAAAYWRAVGP